MQPMFLGGLCFLISARPSLDSSLCKLFLPGLPFPVPSWVPPDCSCLTRFLYHKHPRSICIRWCKQTGISAIKSRLTYTPDHPLFQLAWHMPYLYFKPNWTKMKQMKSLNIHFSLHPVLAGRKEGRRSDKRPGNQYRSRRA